MFGYTYFGVTYYGGVYWPPSAPISSLGVRVRMSLEPTSKGLISTELDKTLTSTEPLTKGLTSLEPDKTKTTQRVH